MTRNSPRDSSSSLYSSAVSNNANAAGGGPPSLDPATAINTNSDPVARGLAAFMAEEEDSADSSTDSDADNALTNAFASILPSSSGVGGGGGGLSAGGSLDSAEPKARPLSPTTHNEDPAESCVFLVRLFAPLLLIFSTIQKETGTHSSLRPIWAERASCALFDDRNVSQGTNANADIVAG